jgi:hypothetical protein
MILLVYANQLIAIHKFHFFYDIVHSDNSNSSNKKDLESTLPLTWKSIHAPSHKKYADSQKRNN